MPDDRQDGEFERELGKWAASESEVRVSPETQRKIGRLLSASLAPVKPLPSEHILALTIFLVFVACAGGLIGVAGQLGFRLMTGRQVVSMTAILGVAGAFFSLALAGRMIPGSRRPFPMSVALALWGTAFAGGIALLFPWRHSISFVSEGWPCAAMELIIAIPAAALFWWLGRRGALFREASLGATLFGLATALALLVVQFRCMSQNATHLLAWHGLAAGALIGAGALVGGFHHRWRRKTST
jgi:hypothetical protein